MLIKVSLLPSDVNINMVQLKKKSFKGHVCFEPDRETPTLFKNIHLLYNNTPTFIIF